MRENDALNLPCLVISRQEAAALKEDLVQATLRGALSVSGYDDLVESINRRTVPS